MSAALARIASGLLLAVTTTACRTGTSRAAGAGDTVYVGVAVGLQSPERYVNVYRGVQLALDELNAARPDGAPVLAIRRAPATAKSPVEVAAAFRDDPAVMGVVGHTESEPTIDAAAVYADRAGGGRRALVAVSPTAAGAYVTQASEWVLRVCPVATQQARLLARYAADTLHLRRVAIVYRNDAMGKDFLGAFGEAFAARGGTVVETDPFTEEIPLFDAYAERLARREVPGVVYVGNAPEALKLIRALHAAGSAPQVLASNPPAAVGGDSAVARDFAGMRYIALYEPDRPLTPTAVRFARAFSERMRARPDHWAALGYDAAMLIGRAVHDVGADRRRVRDKVAAVGRTAPAFEGATGEIRFDEQGDPVDKPIVVQQVVIR